MAEELRQGFELSGIWFEVVAIDGRTDNINCLQLQLDGGWFKG